MKNISSKIIDNKNQIKNYIFREFEKNDDIFIATQNFYLLENDNNNILSFNNITNLNQEKIIPYLEDDNIFVSINNKNYDKKYIDLILLTKISFTLDDININKSELIKKILENDISIDEKLFEDLYYNEQFSKKINIELPKQYNNKKIILEDIQLNKKYLFKINIIELNRIFNQYKV
jgi:hypothetical protein